MLLASSVSCLFKWRQFEPEVILLAVGWYLRFSLSYRDVEELLAERGLHADHVTVWRWVQRYARRWNYVCAVVSNRPATVGGSTRPTSGSRVSGCIYTALWTDSTGATIDFLLWAKRDAAAAERFLAKALSGATHPAPRVINTDKHAGYPPAIVQLKSEAALERNCRHRPVQYLNNVLEQDHRAIKRRINASQHFRSFWGAWRTIAGYEAIHMIRKRQACEGAPGWEGCSDALLHSRPVQRGGGLILSTLSPNFALLQNCNTTVLSVYLNSGPEHRDRISNSAWNGAA